jgi:hypothetical protein
VRNKIPTDINWYCIDSKEGTAQLKYYKSKAAEESRSPTGTKPPWGLEKGLVFIQGLAPVEQQGASLKGFSPRSSCEAAGSDSPHVRTQPKRLATPDTDEPEGRGWYQQKPVIHTTVRSAETSRCTAEKRRTRP